MIIYLKKFGQTLISRQTGREAYSAYQPYLMGIKEGEVIEIDFEGVLVLAPSWADEFITPLQEQFKNKIVFSNTTNASVKATLDLLEDIKSKTE